MEGYAKLSSLMANDTEFAMYRKFGTLNTQNLLYYQAELMGLGEHFTTASTRENLDGVH